MKPKQPPPVLKPGFIIDGKYRVVRKLGAGGCGDVYLAVSISNPEEEVAVKVENIMEPRGLFNERDALKTLQVLNQHSWNVGNIPMEKGYFQDFDLKINMLVMEKLGPSLEQMLQLCGGKFSMKTVLMLADKMLDCLKFVHGMGYVHRDIKPENFVMGVGPNSKRVYIIDFGFAQQYQGIKHMKCFYGLGRAGTPMYASLETHLGCSTPSRRDDLEALGYVLIYFLRGSLPWQHVPSCSKRKLWDQITEIKQTTTVEDLCKGFPPEFAKFINYCRNLSFEGDPHYHYLRKGLFRKLYTKMGYDRDGKFDWDA